jgi:hypothetical protein
MIFGRKSEKLTGELEQLEFRLEELETAQAAEEAAQAATEATQLLPLRLIRSVVRALHASLCRKIFRVKWSPIFPRTTAAPIAAVRCASSAKMFPNNWNASRQAFVLIDPTESKKQILRPAYPIACATGPQTRGFSG